MGGNDGATNRLRRDPDTDGFLGWWRSTRTGDADFKTEKAAQRHCPADTVVWVNTSSANYHLKGDPWYGRTQRGIYACKLEAEKDGLHAWDRGPLALRSAQFPGAPAEPRQCRFLKGTQCLPLQSLLPSTPVTREWRKLRR